MQTERIYAAFAYIMTPAQFGHFLGGGGAGNGTKQFFNAVDRHAINPRQFLRCVSREVSAHAPAMTSFRNLAQALLLCALVVAHSLCSAESLKVTVLLSEGSAPYQAFADAFRKSLPDGAQTTVVDQSGIDQQGALPQGISRSDLIVAAGTKAAELAAGQNSAPVLAVMVTKAGYEDLLNGPSRKFSPKITAIFLNQPWDRQLDFLHATLPERRRIGLLHSPDTRIDVEGLRRLVAKRGGALDEVTVPSSERLYSSLEMVFEGSDLLLAIPDTAIYNSNSIRNILLASYRRGVPLIGLSQSYVNAGALCAIFTTPEQLAEQAGEAVAAYLQDRQLPAPQYPEKFSIALNEHVARSLGIELPSSEAIFDRMEKVPNSKPARRAQ